jgi:hypothetical protein
MSDGMKRARDYRAEVLALYEDRFGRPGRGERYPPEVFHNAPAIMRQTGCSAEVALDKVLNGETQAPNRFGPRAEFPER